MVPLNYTPMLYRNKLAKAPCRIIPPTSVGFIHSHSSHTHTFIHSSYWGQCIHCVRERQVEQVAEG